MHIHTVDQLSIINCKLLVLMLLNIEKKEMIIEFKVEEAEQVVTTFNKLPKPSIKYEFGCTLGCVT